LRDLIREAIGRTSWTARALEKELGIGHGNLSHLLSGELELKLRHLLSLARVLSVPPHRLIELGCPAALAAATRDVSDFVAVPAASRGTIPSDEGALDQRIRAIVRDELASREPAAAPAKSVRKPPAR
jgi:transcriptional regulator with XRE-family HTH domain